MSLLASTDVTAAWNEAQVSASSLSLFGIPCSRTRAATCVLIPEKLSSKDLVCPIGNVKGTALGSPFFAELADERCSRPVDTVDRGVSAGREKGDERKLGAGVGLAGAAKEHGEEMTHEVVDAHERKPARPRQALRHLHADEQRAHEARTVGHRDAVDRIPRDGGLGERLPHDRASVAKVIARRELGDHSVVRSVQAYLTLHDVRKDAPRVVDDGRARLVAGRLDA